MYSSEDLSLTGTGVSLKGLLRGDGVSCSLTGSKVKDYRRLFLSLTTGILAKIGLYIVLRNYLVTLTGDSSLEPYRLCFLG